MVNKAKVLAFSSDFQLELFKLFFFCLLFYLFFGFGFGFWFFPQKMGYQIQGLKKTKMFASYRQYSPFLKGERKCWGQSQDEVSASQFEIRIYMHSINNSFKA